MCKTSGSNGVTGMSFLLLLILQEPHSILLHLCTTTSHPLWIFLSLICRMFPVPYLLHFAFRITLAYCFFSVARFRCNVKGAGFGMRPTSDTGYTAIDAIVWAKPGGECDGTSNTSSPRYDYHCGLACVSIPKLLFLRLPRSSLSSDADQPAPEAGTWFQVRLVLSLSNLPSGSETHWLYSISGILHDAGDQGESAIVKYQDYVLLHMMCNKRSGSSNLYLSKSTTYCGDRSPMGVLYLYLPVQPLEVQVETSSNATALELICSFSLDFSRFPFARSTPCSQSAVVQDRFGLVENKFFYP